MINSQLMFFTEEEIRDTKKEKVDVFRERLNEYGVQSLMNYEALFFLTGIKQEDLKGYPDLHSIEDDIENLKITGLQKHKLRAIFTIAKRLHKESLGERYKISSPNDATDLVMEELRFKKKEHFKVILLDTKNYVISTELISVGSLNSSIVHPREVFNPAVKKSAASMIMIHNHPSGEPEPSHEDVVLTNRLDECGKLMGIKVFDHIIIGDGVYFSFKEEGLI
jgi:DNA repair protein RadC